MSSPPPKLKKTSAVTPHKTMRGHTNYVYGVAHLPSGKHTIIGSSDGSLRLWDLENSAQIGGKWREEGDKAGVWTMALSPNGKTIASGSSDGTVRLWDVDVEMGKVVAKWEGHTKAVKSACWSSNGERVVSGSNDGTARVWDVKSGEPVQGLNPIKTGHQQVWAVSYSPNAKMIATGGPGFKEHGIAIWDARTGGLLSTIKLDWAVCTLAWTPSDEKKLIAGSIDSSIMIFDTAATGQQTAVLEGHTSAINSLTLFPNDRLLASTSWDRTARLWNLDTYLQVGPPLQHQDSVRCAAFSADGKLLSTASDDKYAYMWDIQAILKTAGLENLLDEVYASSQDSSSEEHGRSFLEADATQGFGDASELSPRFFDNTQANARVHSSAIPGARAKFSALLGRFPSLLRRSRHNQMTETQHPLAPSGSRSHALLNRLRSPPNIGTNEFPQPPMLSRFIPQVLLGHLSSLLPRAQLNADEATEPQRSQTPSESRSGALIGGLSSHSRSPPNADEAIELQHPPEPATFPHGSSHVVDVPAMRDREVIFVAPAQARRPATASEMAKRVKNPKPWVRVVFFLCCVSPGTDDSPGTNDTPRST